MVTFNSDIDVLNYALTLEHFEAALYKVLIGANLLTGVEQQYLTTFGGQEQAHVDTLTQVIGQLGGTPVPTPGSYNFAAAGPITNRGQLLAVLQMVEDLGASAYLGAAPYIKDPMLLTAAVTIHAVEAEHAAIFRDLLGMAVAPDAVAMGRTPDQVLAMVTPFLSASGSTSSGSGTGSTGAPSGGGASQSNSTTGSTGMTTTMAPQPPAGGSTTGSPSSGSGSGTGTTGAPSGGGASQSNSTTGNTGKPGGLPPFFNRRLGDG